VLNLRLSVFTIIVALMLFASVSQGQDADADRAKALLKEADGYFKALDFDKAKTTLERINRDDLSAADKNALDGLKTKLAPAIKQQTEARKAYNDAVEALAGGDLAGAKEGFSKAASSEFLPAGTRNDARAQLDLLANKEVAAKAAEELKPLVEAKSPPAAAMAPVPAVEAEPLVLPEPMAPPVATVQPAPSPAAAKVISDVQVRKARVDQLITQGRQALDQNQPERAVGYFQRVLALDPNNEVARRQLVYSKGMVTGVGQTGIISRLEGRRLLAKQQADVEYEAAIKRSQEILGKAERGADFDSAESAARSASNVLETYKDLYSEREYRQKLTQVEDQVTHIRMRRDEWARQRVLQQAEEVSKQEQLRKLREQEERRNKVAQLTDRAKALRAEGKFSQSLDIVKQILVIDPRNSWAADEAESLKIYILTQDEKLARDEQRYHEKKQLVDLREAEIPWWQLLKYPRDWKELTVRRQPFEAARGGESARDREVRTQLDKINPQVELTAVEFEEAIDFLRTTHGLNIYVKWDALELMGIDRAKEVNLNLRNVTTEKALRVILDDVGGTTPLSYVIDEGVITISTKDDLSTNTYTRVYDIRDLIVRVPNFESPSVDVGSGGNDGGDVLGDEDEDDDDNENVPSRQELIDNIITLVTDTIDPDSWPPLGNIGSIRELHGQLVVTQTSDNHQDIVNLIEQLREARALQISIEARFISVNSGFLNSIGIDLDFYFNVGSRLGSTTVTDPWTGATVPTTGGTSGWGASAAGSDKITPIPIGQDSASFTDMIGIATPVSGISGQVTNPAMQVFGTFLDDIQVDFLIEATQAHSATRSLTAPRLTLFNGQQAYIFVGTYQSYVSDLDPVVSDNAIAFNPIPAQVFSGTSLEVEAVISADRRYVTLTVYPSVRNVNSFSNYAVTVTGTDAAGAPLTGEGFIQQPNQAVQQLETTVSVPDGGTLLLGGQRLSGEVEREMGVPLLNKIPILNRAFTNRGTVRDEQTLLILIKPKIIIQTEEEEMQFPS